MKDTIVNQLLAGAKAEMEKVVISESYKEKFRRFEINCFEFKKQVQERIEKKDEAENAPDLWELYEKTLKSYLCAFHELAECYFEDGFRRGFLLSKDLYR